MLIGFTYDLRKDYLTLGYTEEETGELDSQETVDILAGTMTSLGHDVVRIGNIFELVRRLASGERWDMVFNVTEGMRGRSREAQVPALLEAYGIPCTFSDTLTLALTLDKGMTKRVIRDAQIPTPPFWVIDDIWTFDYNGPTIAMRGGPLFLKPNQEGTGKGVSPDCMVQDPISLREIAHRLISRYKQPVLVEQYLPGREFTVGILGTGLEARVAGMVEIKLLLSAEPNVYSYMNKELCEERVQYVPVEEQDIIEEAGRIALDAYRVLGVRDAGRVDLRADDNGRLQFLEVNPLPGLHPTHSDLPILCTQAAMEYRELIDAIIESASERMPKA